MSWRRCWEIVLLAVVEYFLFFGSLVEVVDRR